MISWAGWPNSADDREVSARGQFRCVGGAFDGVLSGNGLTSGERMTEAAGLAAKQAVPDGLIGYALLVSEKPRRG